MNNFFSDFKLGITSYFSAWQLIKNNRMWGYFFYPLCLSLVLSFTFFRLRIEIQDYIEQVLNALINYESWWNWAKWLTSWLIQSSLFVMTWYLYFKIQKYVLLILMSPLLAYLSEKTEEKLTGNTFPFEFIQFLKDINRGVATAIRNLLVELFLLLLLFLAGLIPIFTPFTAAAALLVGWYFYGYAVMDYTNERHKLNINQSQTAIKNKSGLAISNGMVFEIIFFVPILGFIIAPILAVVAATIAMQKNPPVTDTNLISP